MWFSALGGGVLRRWRLIKSTRGGLSLVLSLTPTQAERRTKSGGVSGVWDKVSKRQGEQRRKGRPEGFVVAFPFGLWRVPCVFLRRTRGSTGLAVSCMPHSWQRATPAAAPRVLVVFGRFFLLPRASVRSRCALPCSGVPC